MLRHCAEGRSVCLRSAVVDARGGGGLRVRVMKRSVAVRAVRLLIQRECDVAVAPRPSLAIGAVPLGLRLHDTTAHWASLAAHLVGLDVGYVVNVL